MVNPRLTPELRYKNCKAMLERGRKDAASAKRLTALDQLAALAASSENKTQQRSSHLPMLRSSAVAPVTKLTTPPSWANSVIRLLWLCRKINLSGKQAHFSPFAPQTWASQVRPNPKIQALFPKSCFRDSQGFALFFKDKVEFKPQNEPNVRGLNCQQ